MSAGIVAFAAYLPTHRLAGSAVAQARGGPAAAGERTVAAFDEDPLTMAVEAGRLVSTDRVDGVLFSTSNPPYAAKNNASAAHAALGLPEETFAYDLGGSFRSPLGVLRTAAPGTLLLAGDVTLATPGDADETARGDGAAALLFGPAEGAPVEIVESVSSTVEFLDHWREPGRPAASASEDRFVADRYLKLLRRSLKNLSASSATTVVVSSPGRRTVAATSRALAAFGRVSGLDGTGHLGAADPLVRLVAALEEAAPGDTVLLVGLTDGCDLTLFRRTEVPWDGRLTVRAQLTAGRPVRYLDYLSWRSLLDRAGPRRPDPAVVSSAGSARSVAWKYGLVASRCASCGAVNAPPQRVCVRCGAQDTTEPVALREQAGTIRTFSVDRLAFSLNPPVVAAVVDFDGGGRMEVEIADAAGVSPSVGDRVRMAFRRRHSSGGVHNYAWKAVLDG